MDLSAYLTPSEEESEGSASQSLDNIVLSDTSPKSIVDVLNVYLQTPRFDNDACIVLSMPDTTLKKYREKLNSGLWWMFNRFCKKDFGMMELLVAVDTMVCAEKLNDLLDNDVKLQVAKERGIVVSEDDLDNVHNEAPEIDEEPEEPKKLASMNDDDFMEKMIEDDPEEEAEMLAGLGVLDEE